MSEPRYAYLIARVNAQILAHEEVGEYGLAKFFNEIEGALEAAHPDPDEVLAVLTRVHARQPSWVGTPKAQLDALIAAGLIGSSNTAPVHPYGRDCSEKCRRDAEEEWSAYIPVCGDYPAPCNCDDPETHGGH